MLILIKICELGLHILLHVINAIMHSPRSRLAWPCRSRFYLSSITLNFHHHSIINHSLGCTNFLFFIPLNPSITTQVSDEIRMWKPLFKPMNNRMLNNQTHIYLQPFPNSIYECSPTLHDYTEIGYRLKLSTNKIVLYLGYLLHGLPWKTFEPSINVSFPRY